jgi:hypothetical protein
MNFLGAAEFGPSGTVFKEPVEVSMKLTKTSDGSEISVFCYDEENKIWDYVTEATCEGNIAKFKVTHFSTYKCLNIGKATLEHYIDLVYEAYATGKPDSWITSTYLDYLLNEKHFMHYYQEFCGLYYEPCGILISGSYHLNGKEGDPNELVYLHGEDSTIGNCMGVGKVASLLSSYKECKSRITKAGNKKQTEEIYKQEIVYIMVSIDYKIITPTVDLSAAKTQLKKGESETVEVYCHYPKPTNPIYPDFPLSGYTLIILDGLEHYKVSTQEFTTKSDGKAKFKVTSKGTGEETIQVIFVVIDPAYTRSSGGYEFEVRVDSEITFGVDEGYKITGRIEEELEFEFKFFPYTVPYTILEQGFFKIQVSYDFDGNIFEEDDKEMSGTIYFRNFNINITTDRSVCQEITDEGTPIREEIYYKPLKITPVDVIKYEFTGPLNGTFPDLSINSDPDIDMAEIIETFSGDYWDDEEYSIALYLGQNLIGENVFLDFELVEGIRTVIKDVFKDTFVFFFIGERVDEPKEKTIQTITIQKNNNNEN